MIVCVRLKKTQELCMDKTREQPSCRGDNNFSILTSGLSVVGQGRRLCPALQTPIRKNNRGISGCEQLRTPVADILIVGLQLSLDLPRDGEAPLREPQGRELVESVEPYWR